MSETAVQLASLLVNCTLLWWVARRIVGQVDAMAEKVGSHTALFAAVNATLAHVDQTLDALDGRIGNLEGLAMTERQGR